MDGQITESGGKIESWNRKNFLVGPKGIVFFNNCHDCRVIAPTHFFSLFYVAPLRGLYRSPLSVSHLSFLTNQLN